jgi:hypothetical protein
MKNHGWKYYLMIYYDRKPLLAGRKSTAYNTSEPKATVEYRFYRCIYVTTYIRCTVRSASVQANAARSVGTSVHKRLLSVQGRSLTTTTSVQPSSSLRNRRVSSGDTNEYGKLSVRRYGGATGVHVRPSMGTGSWDFFNWSKPQTFTMDLADLVEQCSRKQWLVTTIFKNSYGDDWCTVASHYLLACLVGGAKI